MADLRFSYSSSFEAYTELIDFLVSTAGWTVVMRRPPRTPGEPGLCVLEGGETGKWDYPAVIGLHWNPGTAQIVVQGFKIRGTLPRGYGDFFGSNSQSGPPTPGDLNEAWTLDPALPNFAVITDRLTLRPVVGTWDPLNTDYTFLYQPPPGRTYAIRATGSVPIPGGSVSVGGVAIRNTGNKFIRLYIYLGATPRIALDTYDGSVYTSHFDIPEPNYVDRISFYLEQLGGFIVAYYKLPLSPWEYLGMVELDERVYFDGNEEIGIFQYADDALLLSEWYEFRWVNNKFGLGEPLFFGGLLDVDPQGNGDFWVSANSNRFNLLMDPTAGTPDILHVGSFLDHTSGRVFDSRITIVKPLVQQCGLYTQVGDNPKIREGITPTENASAALGTPFSIVPTSFQADEQPQIRDGKLLLHPYFVGIQFDGKQLSGETDSLYVTDTSVSAPSDYDLVVHRGSYYLYFGGVAFGPVTDPGGVPIHDGVRATWVSPEEVEEQEAFYPTNFVVYEGAEQPQIIIEWGEPSIGWGEITEMRIQRKLLEYPLSWDDGDTVYLGSGVELGYSDRTVIPNNWYYYKAYVYREGWFSGSELEGSAFSWKSGWGENKLYMSLAEVFRVYDIQRWIMAQSTRSPEVLNFQEENAEKGFLRRFLKNFGLEVDRIKGFHRAFDTVYDPINIRLEWLPWLGSKYNYQPYKESPGEKQKWDLKFWPEKIRKKTTELLISTTVEQILGVAPTLVLGKVRSANANQWQPALSNQHTWNPGAAPGFPNIAKQGHEDDPNCYTHGYRSMYNINGIMIYITGSFNSNLITELKAKLSPFTPITSVIGCFINNEPVFLSQSGGW